MLDIKLIRENADEVARALAKRGETVDFAELLVWDKERRECIGRVTELRARRKTVSADIPKLKKAGKDTAALQAEMKTVGETIKNLEGRLAEVEARIDAFMAMLPNLPAEDVVPGGKEHNAVVRTFGAPPAFDFEPRNHVDLVTRLGLVDYERGVKLGGNGFWLYRDDGARMEWGLLNYFVERHLAAGYEFILPPHILIHQCGYTAGQFPKFKDDVFHLQGEEGKDARHFLLPTAETALINLHRDEILKEDRLPLKYFAYTPCYRKEAGSYRAGERGMIRGHQFNKVEIFQYTRPEDSAAALEEMVAHAESLMQGLGLHYRVSKLAAADCGASMAKTYDVEVWIPSMKEYKEVSSASNAHDFQARRGAIRFRRAATGQNELVHTLNASGLATSRLLPAIVEQGQRKDGSVVVPEALRAAVGKEILRPVQ
ncbi:MAG TPA: serine--tRNA ligase [Planctomycetota bacterium]|nr:serine--tRNA ligase [Planctomycetota bacterium]OQC19290.1 MAG: Serine--tRNA ligase [Planctomycetes bacterium ADurb.Bin069]NMD34907.1 serine--tRNA ligase [Planctomycetota bacterium]HNS00215.1 serine--tRNA ligase [Planctomycetota bacterium]HNU26852.1 serine--tRNA ligase [Planctomycetota bacterium]